MKIEIHVDGQGGRFSIVALSIALGSGIGLLSVASLVTDFLLQNVCKSQKYMERKFDDLLPDNFVFARHVTVITKQDDDDVFAIRSSEGLRKSGCVLSFVVDLSLFCVCVCVCVRNFRLKIYTMACGARKKKNVTSTTQHGSRCLDVFRDERATHSLTLDSNRLDCTTIRLNCTFFRVLRIRNFLR